MSIFWVPDEDDPPRGVPPPSHAVADELARWIDERALQRADTVIRGFTLRVGITARGLLRARLARRLQPPSLGHGRAS
jgi:hypothetical protein